MYSSSEYYVHRLPVLCTGLTGGMYTAYRYHLHRLPVICTSLPDNMYRAYRWYVHGLPAICKTSSHYPIHITGTQLFNQHRSPFTVHFVVNDLQISYRNHRIWAGTYGRGLWSSDLYNTLPLSLLDFTARPVNKTASLKWITAEEKNTKEFSIERSSDETRWAAIGSISARNTSGNNNYSFIDNEPVNGYNYYRFKMIDKDGAFTYSPVRLINFKENNKAITIVPNPAHNYANIVFKTTVSSAAITLFDAQGKKVFTQNLQNHNSNIYRLNTRNFATGTYVLTINSESINGSERLVIQK